MGDPETLVLQRVLDMLQDLVKMVKVIGQTTRKPSSTLCRNGSCCKYLKQGRCWFQHACPETMWQPLPPIATPLIVHPETKPMIRPTASPTVASEKAKCYECGGNIGLFGYPCFMCGSSAAQAPPSGSNKVLGHEISKCDFEVTAAIEASRAPVENVVIDACKGNEEYTRIKAELDSVTSKYFQRLEDTGTEIQEHDESFQRIVKLEMMLQQHQHGVKDRADNGQLLLSEAPHVVTGIGL